ncbi:hypothetical protein A3Q56_04205 [Intoshia linei]|uniref:Uncharacterized protein n=1 Tax=Intoshia linei TaxID=1819745 RepID=A0A177B1T1_9BILA|nr:hypothetical protein A3Q56_04205 [Intoshia linei]
MALGKSEKLKKIIYDDGNVYEKRKLIIESGAVQDCIKLAQFYCSKAMDSVLPLKDKSIDIDILQKLVNVVLYRCK